jgi:arylsulfatase A-like enzyme
MGVPVPEETLTLPRLLKPYGYRSANIGKLHFLPHANRDHRLPHPDYGFDELEIADEPGPYEDAYQAWVSRVAPDQIDRISVGLPPSADVWYKTMGLVETVNHPGQGGRFDFKGAIPFRGDEHVTHSAFVADQTIEFLRRQSDQPFLCIAGFYSPHAPWMVPQRYLDLYQPDDFTLPTFPPELEAQRAADQISDEQLRSARHGYYAMVSEVDHHVGRILDQLEQQGLSEDTIVIFTSDHGEWLGEHLRYGKGYPGHDQVSRVPLLVRWPAGVIEPGRRVEQLVEGVDVIPTLLNCAGIQVSPHLQGHSFASALSNENFAGRGAALMEHAGWKTLRTDQYRYLIQNDGREKLWDLTQDPAAYEDVAGQGDYQDVLAEHRRLLLQRLVTMERPLPRIWTY